MKIDLSMSSILPMIRFLQDLKNGQADRNYLKEIFSHPDYDYEFKRYEIIDKESMVDYFMQLNTIDEISIPEPGLKRKKGMLKHKHKLWLDAYENPEYYESLLGKIDSQFDVTMLENICLHVKRGLPEDLEIGSIKAISTMSIGTSFGYVFDGAFHFDIMGFENGNTEGLQSLIAHEVHHLAFISWISAFYDALTLEEKYILGFAGEGLAVKFCNNAQGVISKAIDSDAPVNDGLDAYSMKYLNEHFDEARGVFFDTLEKIRADEIGQSDISKQHEEYWLNLYADGQAASEEPLLKQAKMYSFGNDLFGSIYDAYGAKVLFECVRQPLKAVEYFKLISC